MSARGRSCAQAGLRCRPACGGAPLHPAPPGDPGAVGDSRARPGAWPSRPAGVPIPAPTHQGRINCVVATSERATGRLPAAGGAHGVTCTPWRRVDVAAWQVSACSRVWALIDPRRQTSAFHGSLLWGGDGQSPSPPERRDGRCRHCGPWKSYHIQGLHQDPRRRHQMRCHRRRPRDPAGEIFLVDSEGEILTASVMFMRDTPCCPARPSMP